MKDRVRARFGDLRGQLQSDLNIMNKMMKAGAGPQADMFLTMQEQQKQAKQNPIKPSPVRVRKQMSPMRNGSSPMYRENKYPPDVSRTTHAREMYVQQQNTHHCTLKDRFTSFGGSQRASLDQNPDTPLVGVNALDATAKLRPFGFTESSIQAVSKLVFALEFCYRSRPHTVAQVFDRVALGAKGGSVLNVDTLEEFVRLVLHRDISMPEYRQFLTYMDIHASTTLTSGELQELVQDRSRSLKRQGSVSKESRKWSEEAAVDSDNGVARLTKSRRMARAQQQHHHTTHRNRFTSAGGSQDLNMLSAVNPFSPLIGADALDGTCRIKPFGHDNSVVAQLEKLRNQLAFAGKTRRRALRELFLKAAASGARTPASTERALGRTHGP
jgi:hypothetical protein